MSHNTMLSKYSLHGNCMHLLKITIVPSIYLSPCGNYYTVTVFLPGFSTLGSTGPIEKLKGAHEGEKQVKIF